MLLRRVWMYAPMLVAAAGAVLPVQAKTITITAKQRQSGFVGYVPAPLYSSQVYDPRIVAGVFDFHGTAFGSLRSIESVTLTLTLASGDSARGEADFDQYSLKLDGLDTDIKLNGFPFAQWATRQISGSPDNADAILKRLKAHGYLEATLHDNCCAFGPSREYTVIVIPSTDFQPLFNWIWSWLGDPSHPLTDPATMALFAAQLQGQTGSSITAEQIASIIVNLPTTDTTVLNLLGVKGPGVTATLSITGEAAENESRR